jgi:5-enolpyruvylshikimate-3-phosphate synthase
VATGADWIEIRPGTSPSKEPVLLDPRGDHRMVFTFALCGLVRDGVRVRDAQASVAKSWRTFWSDLERLGAQLTRG